MNILIVEDHVTINNLLAKFARSENHFVFQAFTIEDALKVLETKTFDLIITDLMFKNLQGEDLIKEIRKVSDIYIIVISAKVDLENKIDLLKLGVDDYLTKPFSVMEVMAKLKNIEVRLKTFKPLIYSFNQGSLKLTPLKKEVRFNGEVLQLTPYEYETLFYLVLNDSLILSRDQIINNITYDSEASDRVVDAFIKNLRKKLNDDVFNPKFIKTHYGLGYQFIGEKDD